LEKEDYWAARTDTFEGVAAIFELFASAAIVDAIPTLRACITPRESVTVAYEPLTGSGVVV
jgi:hypothetical protein